MLLVWVPSTSLSLAGGEHGRTIPLADIDGHWAEPFPTCHGPQANAIKWANDAIATFCAASCGVPVRQLVRFADL